MIAVNIKNLNSPVAENVRRIIKEAGLKQCSVADKIGYSSQEFADMLCGRRIIKVNDVPKISKALGVDIGTLFGFPTERAV